MERGPPGIEIGTAACPLCHRDFIVMLNKHGWPAGMCRACETQYQPRGEIGSLLMLGRIHTWSNPVAAAAMIPPAEQNLLAAHEPGKPPRLPPHLAAETPPAMAEVRQEPTHATPQREVRIRQTGRRPTRPRPATSIWDREL